MIGAGVTWSSAQWTPKLALDLEGGTEIVLQAVPQPGASGTITQDTLDEATIQQMQTFPDDASIDRLKTLGVRYIVVHRAFYEPAEHASLLERMLARRQLKPTGRYRDPAGQAELFELTAEDGRRGYTLEVRISNAGAIRLYERLGFTTVGVYREQGWLDGAWVDVVIMEKLL